MKVSASFKCKKYESVCLLNYFLPTGINSNANHMLYTQTQQRVILYSGHFSVVFLSAIIPLGAFVPVAIHWCMGSYTIDSWSFYWPVWYEIQSILNLIRVLHVCSFLFASDRTPFELNTFYCAMIVILQCSCCLTTCIVFYAIVCLLIELTTYADTFIIDIKSVFNKLDDLAKTKLPKLSMLACCKVAVNLHNRVFR